MRDASDRYSESAKDEQPEPPTMWAALTAAEIAMRLARVDIAADLWNSLLTISVKHPEAKPLVRRVFENLDRMTNQIDKASEWIAEALELDEKEHA